MPWASSHRPRFKLMSGDKKHSEYSLVSNQGNRDSPHAAEFGACSNEVGYNNASMSVTFES